MSENQKTNLAQVSPRRLRLGVILILLWFLPFWILAAPIASMLNSSNSDHLTTVLTALIMIVQTIIGIIGVYVAGSEVKDMVKTGSKKQALGQIWYILIHGKLSSAEKT